MHFGRCFAIKANKINRTKEPENGLIVGFSMGADVHKDFVKYSLPIVEHHIQTIIRTFVM